LAQSVFVRALVYFQCIIPDAAASYPEPEDLFPFLIPVKKGEGARQQRRFKEAAETMIPRGYDSAMKTYNSAAVGTGSIEEEEDRHLLDRKPVRGFPMPFVFADEPAPRRGWRRLLPFPQRDPEHIRDAKALKAKYDASFR
jgi:hypothetical protein